MSFKKKKTENQYMSFLKKNKRKIIICLSQKKKKKENQYVSFQKKKKKICTCNLF